MSSWEILNELQSLNKNTFACYKLSDSFPNKDEVFNNIFDVKSQRKYPVQFGSEKLKTRLYRQDRPQLAFLPRSEALSGHY